MTTSQKIPAAMQMGFGEDNHVDFFTFQSWLGHYASHVREGKEAVYQAWLEGVVKDKSSHQSHQATAKAVYRWGPRLDSTKVP